MPGTSALVQALSGSATVALSDTARRLAAQGRDVISLATGDPDIPTPPHIVEAAVRALREGDTHYPPSRGTPALIEAIVDKLARENGVRVDARGVIVTPGAKAALFAALRALLDPGDEVLLLDPSWVSYAPMVRLAGGTPVQVPLDAAVGYRIDDDVLQRHWSRRTKALILNSPCNPTGRVATDAELDAVARFAVQRDLFVISDEIYEHYLFDGARHRSLAADPELAPRTLIVNGFSKTYAMTGWRLGWLAGPAEIIGLAARVHSQTWTSAASFTMAAGCAALTGPQEWLTDAVSLYGRRRDAVLEVWAGRPGIECAPVEGTFYLFPRLRYGDGGSEEFARVLLEAQGVACVPGAAFGPAGEGHLRLSLTAPEEQLREAAERIALVAEETAGRTARTAEATAERAGTPS